MTKSRGLITDTERARISGEVNVEQQRKYEAVSRVRRRIREQLPEEMAILEEHHPQLLGELQEAVCEDEDRVLEPGDRMKTTFGMIEITPNGVIMGQKKELDEARERTGGHPWLDGNKDGEDR